MKQTPLTNMVEEDTLKKRTNENKNEKSLRGREQSFANRGLNLYPAFPTAVFGFVSAVFRLCTPRPPKLSCSLTKTFIFGGAKAVIAYETSFTASRLPLQCVLLRHVSYSYFMSNVITHYLWLVKQHAIS
jgi:hypothetical protein